MGRWKVFGEDRQRQRPRVAVWERANIIVETGWELLLWDWKTNVVLANTRYTPKVIEKLVNQRQTNQRKGIDF